MALIIIIKFTTNIIGIEIFSSGKREFLKSGGLETSIPTNELFLCAEEQLRYFHLG